MLNKFFQNTCKPVGSSGKLMVRMMNKGHSALADWGLSHLPMEELPSAAKTLDIGCGGGANLSQLLTRFGSGTATGIDYSPLCVQESTKMNQDAVDSGRCRILQGDASRLPFSNGSFHVATAFETVYFWPDLDASFRQIYQMLQTGGAFLICNEESDPTNDRWTKIIGGMTIYSIGDLKKRMENAGFTNILTDFEPKKHWCCLVARKLAC